MRVGSFAIEVSNLWRELRQWWNGDITFWQLLQSIGDLSRRVVDRYLNVPSKTSLKNAYEELAVPQGSNDIALIESKFRELVKIHHPDKGGSQSKFEEIVTARGIIMASLGKGKSEN